MCGGFIKQSLGITARIVDPLNVLGLGGQEPDRPKVKKPPTLDPAEQERRSQEAARVRRVQAGAGLSFFDTRVTGALGIPGDTGKSGAQRGLIGA